MKIGILTQPLTNNYGGLLQAYALQTVLKRMGHDVIILDRRKDSRGVVEREAITTKWIRVIKNIIISLLSTKSCGRLL